MNERTSARPGRSRMIESIFCHRTAFRRLAQIAHWSRAFAARVCRGLCAWGSAAADLAYPWPAVATMYGRRLNQNRMWQRAVLTCGKPGGMVEPRNLEATFGTMGNRLRERGAVQRIAKISTAVDRLPERMPSARSEDLYHLEATRRLFSDVVICRRCGIGSCVQGVSRLDYTQIDPLAPGSDRRWW